MCSNSRHLKPYFRLIWNSLCWCPGQGKAWFGISGEGRRCELGFCCCCCCFTSWEASSKLFIKHSLFSRGPQPQKLRSTNLARFSHFTDGEPESQGRERGSKELMAQAELGSNSRPLGITASGYRPAWRTAAFHEHLPQAPGGEGFGVKDAKQFPLRTTCC